MTPPEVTDLVTAQADARPHAAALVAGGRRLAYRALERSANQVAHRLAEHGLGPEHVVAVAGDRTAHSIVAVLGVLKAGCAYLPFDPAEPATRLRDMFAAAGVRAVVGATPIDGLPHVPVTGESAAPPRVPRHPARLAYVIFTSGSTGTPKGVCVEHRALATFVDWYRRRCALDTASVVGQFYRLAFDASIGEIFPALCSGALLVVPTAAEVRSPAAVEALVRHHGITHLDLPAPMWDAMRPADCPSLRVCTTGGDPVAAATVAHCAGAGRVVRNAYGPTEATSITVLADCDPRSAGAPPIGCAAPGTTAHVLDEHLTPVPDGRVGQLHLGGAQLARGYAADPAATAAAFVPDPWSPGGRLYRTGDLVRRDRDGTLWFVGRVDRQVKVAGYRVEPGEVEHALLRCAGVRAAVVTAPADGERRRLVGHLVGDADMGEVDVAAVRAELRTMLPAHLVPSRLVVHPALPYTPNGKLDRDALDRLPLVHGTADSPVDVVADVLGHPVDPWDTLTGAGGDSLDALRVVARLRERGLAVDPALLLAGTPLADVACQPAAGHAVIADGTPADPVPMTPIQSGMWFVQLLRPDAPMYNLPFAVELRGRLDVDAMRDAWHRVRDRHEAMRYQVTTSAGGPAFTVTAAGAAGGLRCRDLTGGDPDRRADELAALLAGQLAEPVDLRTGVPVRAELVRLAADRHVLLVTAHHLVFDGWSFGVLIRDLNTAYLAAVGRAADGEPPVRGFGGYARWIAGHAAAGGWADGVAYWRDSVRGTDGRLFIAAGRPSGHGHARVFDLPASTGRALRELGTRHGATPFVPLLTGCARGLAAWSGRDDFVLAVASANRPDVAAEHVVGMFANSVPLRVHVPPGEPYEGSLLRVARRVTESLPYWDVPLPLVVAAAEPDRRATTGQPLASVVFSFDTTPAHRFRAGEVTGTVLDEGPGQGAQNELCIRVSPCGESYHCVVVADRGALDESALTGIERALRLAWQRVAAP